MGDSRAALGNRVQLRVQLADDLRRRLREGEWPVGAQLPTEGEIAGSYAVSRSTVRAALQSLENQGLTVTRHGVGTFATPYSGAIRSGLQGLESMSDTVRANGMTPGMDFRVLEFRPATDEQAAALGIEPGDRVLVAERAVLADGEAVAFSFDAVPAALLPENADPRELGGSLFAMLESHDLNARTAIADVHAVSGAEVGWDQAEPAATFLLLTQTHYDADARALMYSHTYFREGKFQFSIVRSR